MTTVRFPCPLHADCGFPVRVAEPPPILPNVAAPRHQEPWRMTAQQIEHLTDTQAMRLQRGFETWQVPQRLFAKGKWGSETARGRARNHFITVRNALSEGKPVPAEVLAEYPELAPKVAAPPPPGQMSFAFLPTDQPGRAGEPVGYEPPVSPPKGEPDAKPGFKLFPFQQRAVEWLQGKQSGILADEMGVGKTAPAIAWGAKHRPVLVVVPASLVYNWAWKELGANWRRNDKVVILKSSDLMPDPLPDWTIVSYGQLETNLPRLRRAGFSALILDEAHYAKNPKSLRGKAVLDMVAPLDPRPHDRLPTHRLAITGTPMPNGLADIWAPLVFIGAEPREIVLGSGRNDAFPSFLSRWKSSLGKLHERLAAGLMLRRTKAEVYPDMPPKFTGSMVVPLSNAAEYTRAEETFQNWLRTKATLIPSQQVKAEALMRMGELRRLSAIGKVQAVADWLDMSRCVTGEHKTIVFSAFIEPLRLLHELHPDSLLFTGEASREKRNTMVEQFQKEPNVCYFLGTYGAAGVGLTLTKADRVLLLDLPWTPAEKQQAEDRAHRFGQKSPVTVTAMLGADTIDERVLEILTAKEQAEGVVLGGKSWAQAGRESIANDILASYQRDKVLRLGKVAEPPQYVPEPDGELVSLHGQRVAEPRRVNFTQFLAERGIEDPGLDHGGLGPSGHESHRARTARLRRLEMQTRRFGEERRAYQRLINTGVLVDPTGRFTPIVQAAPELAEAARLRQRAGDLRGLADRGMRPRAHRAEAAHLEAQAAALLTKVPTPPGVAEPRAVKITGKCSADPDTCTLVVKREPDQRAVAGVGGLRDAINELSREPEPPAPMTVAPSEVVVEPVRMILGGRQYAFAPATVADMIRVADQTDKTEKGFLLCEHNDGMLHTGARCEGGACSIRLTDCVQAGGITNGSFHTHPNDGWFEKDRQRTHSTGDLISVTRRGGPECVSGARTDTIACAAVKKGEEPRLDPAKYRRSYPYLRADSDPRLIEAVMRFKGKWHPEVGKHFEVMEFSKAALRGRPLPGGGIVPREPEPAPKAQRLFATVADSAKVPTVRIVGKCSGDSDTCAFRVAGANRATAKGTLDQIPEAIERVRADLAATQSIFIPPETAHARRGAEQGPVGTTFAVGSSGRRYDFAWRVEEAPALITSHDPMTFDEDPRFTQKLQPRARDRAATREQVLRISGEIASDRKALDPTELLTDFHRLDVGAPIIGPDMLVESGNGRVMAIRRAVTQNPAVYERYKLALIAAAEADPALGLSPEGVRGLHAPVLVRLRLTSVDRTAFVREANEPPTISRSPVEKARTDAELITVEMLEGLQVGENEPIAVALKSSRNAAFTRRFLNGVPAGERAELVDSSGALSQPGVQRIVTALFVATFPGKAGLSLAERYFEATDTGVLSVFAGLSRALGPLAQSEAMARMGIRDPDLSIGEDVAQVVRMFATIKSGSLGLTGVDDYLAQQQLEARALTPFQEDMLRAFVWRKAKGEALGAERIRSGKWIGGLFAGYAASVVAQPPPQQAAMFAAEKPTKAELWAAAVRAMETEPEGVLVGDRLASIERPLLHLRVTPDLAARVERFGGLRNWLLMASTRYETYVLPALLGDALIITVRGPAPSLTVLLTEAKRLMKGMARPVRSAVPGEMGLEVVLPREEVTAEELLGGKQYVEHDRPRHVPEGEQARLFEPHRRAAHHRATGAAR